MVHTVYVVLMIKRLPPKPGVAAGSIHGFSSLSDVALSRVPFFRTTLAVGWTLNRGIYIDSYRVCDKQMPMQYCVNGNPKTGFLAARLIYWFA